MSRLRRSITGRRAKHEGAFELQACCVLWVGQQLVRVYRQAGVVRQIDGRRNMHNVATALGVHPQQALIGNRNRAARRQKARRATIWRWVCIRVRSNSRSLPVCFPTRHLSNRAANAGSAAARWIPLSSQALNSRHRCGAAEAGRPRGGGSWYMSPHRRTCKPPKGAAFFL